MTINDVTQGIGALCVVVAAGVAYFLPSLIASTNDHPHKGGVQALNFLLGWTVLGWALAMVWACAFPAKKTTVGG